MEESECRLCASLTKRVKMEKLFRRQNHELLSKIEQLTGLTLNDVSTLPANICLPCKIDLEKAHQFRLRCLHAHEYFSSEKFQKATKEREASLQCKSNKDRETETTNDTAPLAVKKEECIFEDRPTIDGDSETNVEKSKPLNVKKTTPRRRCVKAKETAISTPQSEQPEVEKTDSNNTTEQAIDNLFDGGEPEQYSFMEDEALAPFLEEWGISNEPSNELDENHSCRKISTKKDRSKAAFKTKHRQKSDGVLICDQCGNHFTCRHHFLIHLRRHAGDKRFQCEICSTKFFTHSELNRHMRRHTGEKPFECKFCQRRFTDFSSRSKHERTHTNDRPFGCTHCEKSFTTSYVLKNHLLIHTGERPFKCLLCDKTFQRQTHLTTHNRSLVHKDKEHKLQMQQACV